MTKVHERFLPSIADPDLLDSPAFHRNGAAILEILKQELSPTVSSVLEIGSGTGQHAELIAREFPLIQVQPTDIKAEHRAGISARQRKSGLKNLLDPITIDLQDVYSSPPMAGPAPSVILCFNVIHIAPTTAMAGLVEFASNNLAADGKLILYGPYQIHSRHTSQSNADFDKSLKQRNPEWGVRDIEIMDSLAGSRNLVRTAMHPMPANNFMPVYQRRAIGDDDED